MISHATGIICWSPLTVPPLASPLFSSRRFSFSLTWRSLIQCSINFCTGWENETDFHSSTCGYSLGPASYAEEALFSQPISDNFYKTIPGWKCVAVLGFCHSTAFIYMWASYLIFPRVNFSVLNLLFTFKKQSSWPLIPFPLLLALPPALSQGVICFTYRL